MHSKTKILIVDPDIDSLSKVYLALLHRNYKVEACDCEKEVQPRLKRFKPDILIIHEQFYWDVEKKLKIPVIVLLEELNGINIHEQEDIKLLVKPVHADQ